MKRLKEVESWLLGYLSGKDWLCKDLEAGEYLAHSMGRGQNGRDVANQKEGRRK